MPADKVKVRSEDTRTLILPKFVTLLIARQLAVCLGQTASCLAINNVTNLGRIGFLWPTVEAATWSHHWSCIGLSSKDISLLLITIGGLKGCLIFDGDATHATPPRRMCNRDPRKVAVR